jgi:3-oxoacyl-[acyl-carrier protein] reductase
MAQKYRLDDKVAVITGCASGVGEATAKMFTDQGARVFAVDVNGPGLKEAMSGVSGVEILEQDVTAVDAAETIVDAAVDAFGQIDILVNNAGRVQYAELADLTDEVWDMHFDLNVKAAMRLCRAAVPEIQKQETGRVVNIGSAVTLRSTAGLASYTASKHALEGLTRVLSQELIPKITVNCIHPSTVLSGMTRPIMEADPTLKEYYENFSPMGRMAMPEDIAHAALFLCLPETNYINGIGLNVDGGYCAAG